MNNILVTQSLKLATKIKLMTRVKQKTRNKLHVVVVCNFMPERVPQDHILNAHIEHFSYESNLQQVIKHDQKDMRLI